MAPKRRLRLLAVAMSLILGYSLSLSTLVHAQSDTETGQRLLFLPLVYRAQSSGQRPDEQLHRPYEYILIEGDIQAPMDFLAVQASDTEATYGINLWPNGIVPFEFNANVTQLNQARMLAAMSEWEGVATVDFTQCSNNNCSGDHLHIQNSTVNNSWVGMRGGEQVINIVSWNAHFIIAHELGHALGYWHEQSRPDRNTFIQVNSPNICKATDTACSGGFCFDNAGNRIDCDFAFAIVNDARTYGPYDFDSVMHYGRTAFSRNGNDTITVLAPNQAWQNAIGQRDHLSVMDRLTMSFLYPQSTWRFVDTNHTGTQAGSFLAPRRQFGDGVNNTPEGGTLWVQPGTYSAVGTFSKPLTVRAPLGGVTLGP